MKNSINNIRKIVIQRRYFIFLLSVSFMFFILNVIIKNVRAVKGIFSTGLLNALLFLGRLVIGFKETIPISIFIAVIVISLLTGLFFTTVLYKVVAIRKINGQLGLLGTAGIFLGIFIPGCAACSVGVLGILGFTGASLGLLPLKGLELQIISIFLLIFGILYISRNMPNSCSVNSLLKKRL